VLRVGLGLLADPKLNPEKALLGPLTFAGPETETADWSF
jgi:hypothetical protein